MHLCPANPEVFNNRKYRKDFQICPSLQRWRSCGVTKMTKTDVTKKLTKTKHLSVTSPKQLDCALSVGFSLGELSHKMLQARPKSNTAIHYFHLITSAFKSQLCSHFNPTFWPWQFPLPIDRYGFPGSPDSSSHRRPTCPCLANSKISVPSAMSWLMDGGHFVVAKVSKS